MDNTLTTTHNRTNMKYTSIETYATRDIVSKHG